MRILDVGVEVLEVVGKLESVRALGAKRVRLRPDLGVRRIDGDCTVVVGERERGSIGCPMQSSLRRQNGWPIGRERFRAAQCVARFTQTSECDE